ncbi:transposase [Novosphingobium pentaromativorans US6-1]|uniref:Transposase n=2 Tax=Alphaproteobacteria TaxID=28211 RepID=A0A0G3XMT9_9SPHN|nr:transposase [Novosphingobium pentaromativorans US6-1]AIT79054.1 transposase [Novosphingobium pentaromativorans US6-1]AKM11969.1 transposase [Croceicoccus naphthovorans]AKM12155.1 transposase [Croceicoccus naphthovorans]
MTGRVEIVGRVSGRRRWTVEQKLAILRDAFGPDGSVRSACERHEVGSGQLYTWRRLAMSGELTGTRRTALPAFAEVEISEPLLPAVSSPARAGGEIGIELPSGVKLTVDTAVDADALARVISVLSQ